MLRQPRAVWAVAFACVIAFMGIGLVDPILKPIADQLGARVESVGPRRGALIDKGMLYSPSHGETAFTVPLFDEFLRRRMP